MRDACALFRAKSPLSSTDLTKEGTNGSQRHANRLAMCPWQRPEEQLRGAAHKGPGPPLSSSCWLAVRCLLCLSGVRGQGSRSGFIRPWDRDDALVLCPHGHPLSPGVWESKRAPALVYGTGGARCRRSPGVRGSFRQTAWWHETLSRTRAAVSALHVHVAENLAVSDAGRDLRCVPLSPVRKAVSLSGVFTRP